MTKQELKDKLFAITVTVREEDGVQKDYADECAAVCEQYAKEQYVKVNDGITLAQAVDVLCKSLAGDKSEGSYYYSWQANIAMSLLDELKPANFEYDSLHEVANKGAKRFLDLLISTTKPISKINP